MSGIVGIWNLDGRPAEPEVLARMSATLAHRGPDGEGVWSQGPVGFACQLNRVTPEAAEETQPMTGSSGAVILFDGRLDNREELLASLDASHDVSPSSPDPALILAAYAAFGEKFPECLTGDFALGLFDPTDQRLLLVRDAIGVRPLYYWRNQRTFLFASEIKALLAHPEVSAKPNDDQLADFLLTHVRDQEMTFFEGIRSLPPAHMVLLSPRGLAKRRYWDFDPEARVRLGSFDEYAEAFRHLFEQAVRRRLRSAHPVVVSVSGGLDSSAILCVGETLCRSQPGIPPLHGMSYVCEDGSPADEGNFLIEIEKKYGTTIHRVPIGTMGLLDGSEDVVWHGESPRLEEQWSTVRDGFRTVQQLDARVVLMGSFGDQVLFSQTYLVSLFRRLTWRKVGAHLNEFGLWYDDVDPKVFRRGFFKELLKYQLLRRLYPLARGLWHYGRIWFTGDRQWFSASLRRRASRRAWNSPIADAWKSPSSQAISIYEEARSAYHVLSMELNNKLASIYALETTYPFLDRDLLAFLMAIPGEVLARNGVPKGLLRAALRDVLPEAIALRRSKGDFTHLVNEAVQRHYPRVVRILEANGLAVALGYLRRKPLRENLQRLKDQIRGPTCEVAWSISKLTGLELWLRTFFVDNDNTGTYTWTRSVTPGHRRSQGGRR